MTVDTQASSSVMIKSDLGQLLMCGFDGLEPTPGIVDLIENHNLGSIILFSRNIDTPDQLRRLTASLQQIARRAGHKRPLFIAVDQENGVVRRLGSKSGTYLPGSMALGALGSSTAARDVAISVSEELLSLGINWNLAPVLDVNNNPLNPVIGVRSFGENPTEVGRLGLAQVEGYHRGHVATSVKHFPGHGDTATDSHIGVPVIDKSLEELEQVELVPFRQTMHAGPSALTYPSSIMIAHIVLPQITEKQVASLSRAVVTDLLRRRMGYEGIIITDCLEMEAVKDTVGTPEGALEALRAGNDMAMISHTFELQRRAFDLLYNAYDQCQLDLEALQKSCKRVEQLKDRFLTWDIALDNMPPLTKPVLELSERLYNKVPTIVRDNKNNIPIQPKKGTYILFLAAHVPQTLAIDSEVWPFDSFHQSLVKRHSNIDYIIYTPGSDIGELTESIRKADWVIIGTANANLHTFQVDMVKHVHKEAKRLVVAAVMNPYDLMAFPEIDTYVVAYEYTPPAHEAAIKVIFGETTPNSKLPVTIPDVTLSKKQSTCMIEKYDPKLHLDGVTSLWDEVFGLRWPLAIDKMEKALRTALNGNHWIAANSQTGAIIGFVATQTNYVDKRGELMLLMTSPKHEGRGIGTLLHDHALDDLRSRSCNAFMLGSTYPRFFPGLPEDKEQHQGFFERRGWKFQLKQVWDLMGNLGQRDSNDETVEDRMRRENIWFGRIKPSQLWELYAFQQRYFSHWLATYQHHAELGDFQDLLVARQDNANGKLLASLVLNTTHTTHPDRGDLIWTDDTLFTEASGGMACVGVAEEERGRGIGLGIVVKANQILKQRGVQKSYVDWVELIDFYRRTGYEKWRGYRTAAL
ncbi:glycoside hydrolase superfamily [Zychaea mexicana]|uniref:glycoside hydrolase superfamily n=1 Tax=Zychaea mexicana TaxID=64656 RepID=UPI0022FE33A7|nr:glycoside hydrolase superfamily [Zychaea mexicana]KAI9484373.1 glycoside hydrolase superfamily [Zychaea mexicana]